MRLYENRIRYLVLGGMVCLCCGFAISELCGQGPLHDRAPPPCVLDGACLPNRTSWGYYQPKWRRWPGSGAVGAPTTATPDTDLPTTSLPDPEEEERRVPLPSTPQVPYGPASDAGTAPPVDSGSPSPIPFEGPTPAVPLPNGGGAGNLLPSAPLPNDTSPGTIPSAPLPSTPLPGTPLPNGITPQPMPTAPTPDSFNPFNGTGGGPTSQRNDDPPPALPPGLRSARQARDAARSVQRNATGPGLAAGVTRLPATASNANQRNRYEVRQASATVWASGTEDIVPSDPNAGRVQQAIHHEPVE